VTYSSGGGYGPPQPPNNHLVMAILTTLFCCSPFGIPAIYHAAQVNARWSLGDYAGAQSSAAEAKKWWIVGLSVGGGFYVLVGIFYAFVFASVITQTPLR
jgi:hypothetical protein